MKNRDKPGVGRTKQLEDEAVSMERKLTALKEAMAKEKEKRELMRGCNPGGSIWTAASKGTSDVRKQRSQPRATGRQPGAHQQGPPRPPSGSPAASARAGGAAAAAVAPPEGIAGRRQPMSGREGRPREAAAARSPSAEKPAGALCGPDEPDGGRTWDGEVDEEANRREFLAALAAWRAGGADRAGAEAGPSRAETHTATEPPRAASQRRRPYFDKLLRESQARSAGERAAAELALRGKGPAGAEVSAG
eukprot:CAMPEP_0177593320 /NCGR_PEP_ID=MMETSP0419_2-20121207/9075_1 /TAXON_ID=582737 /ORGANISM="Tetraselmis sp., Strain GSL018" /LENGTH=248 /DNA_ID=CAMNT_0019084335 /DNA_START=145 /DNA_END=891 /DNA_ORIENTATION=-